MYGEWVSVPVNSVLICFARAKNRRAFAGHKNTQTFVSSEHGLAALDWASSQVDRGFVIVSCDSGSGWLAG